MLALIYKNVQLPDVSATMDQTTIDTLTKAVQIDFPNMVNQIAGSQVRVRVHVAVIDRPLSEMVKSDQGRYEWIPESAIAPELDTLTKSGWYDHVFAFHGLYDPVLGPGAWWGGGIYRHGMSFANLNFSPTNNTVLNEHAVPGMIHEWIHGLESQYFSVRGVSKGLDPNGTSLDLHDAQAFGYGPNSKGRPGWSAWYGDFLTDNILNLHADGSNSGLGLGPDAWSHGVPREDESFTAGSPLTLPDLSTDRLSYLSDVYWVKSVSGTGTVQRDKSLNGNPIKLNGTAYPKGVGLKSNGEIIVNLRGRANSFLADIGIDDDITGSSGSAVFKVYGDGQLLYQSGVLTGASAAPSLNINVLGVQQLRLVVEDGGNGNTNDHGVWANARFLPFQGQFISDIPWTSASTQWGTVRSDKSTDGDPLTINGTIYGKGVGIHAFGEVVIPLKKQYTRFRSYVGLNDTADLWGTISFQAYLDGIKVYDSGTMTGSTPAGYVDIDCRNANELKLVIEDGGNGINSDHGVWGHAYLLPIDTISSTIASWRSGKFYLDTNRNQAWNGTTGGDQVFSFGSATDSPVVGDWNGDGITDIGVFRAGKFYLDTNGNRVWNNVNGGDALVSFGNATDLPISGDWNGDGMTDIGVFRAGKFYLDTNGNRKWDGVTGGDQYISFGTAGDLPIIGDWNGDSLSDIGISRSGKFYLDANGNRAWNNLAGGDAYFNFGTTGDQPVAGDWNGDGKADVGILRNGIFYLDGNGNRVWNNTSGGDLTYAYGLAGDIPLVGTWKTAIGSTAVPKSVGETPIVPDKGRGGIIDSEMAIGFTTLDVDRLPASAMAVPAKKKTRLIVDELFASSESIY